MLMPLRSRRNDVSVLEGERMVRHCQKIGSMLCAVAMALAFPLQAVESHPVDFTVNDTRDLPDKNLADGKCRTHEKTCTLRAAIQQANFLEGARTINLPEGIYTLTIEGPYEDEAATGDLDILTDLTIRGGGPRRVIVRSGVDDRLFDIHPGVKVSIAGVTIQDGNVDDSGGGVRNAGELLTIRQSTITGNFAVGDGGGIHNIGTMELFKSTVSGNTALNSGGGLANAKHLSVTNSTISGNRVEAFGAEKGGGIRNLGSAAIKLRNVTINDNAVDGEVPEGGAIANEPGGSVELTMTIVAHSLTSENCLGTMTSLGHNLDSGTSCGFMRPGDLSNTDPRLGSLANNQGPTDTHALLSGSPAIDVGTNVDCPNMDQRGVARPQDGDGDAIAICDIGAFEAQFLGWVPIWSTPTAAALRSIR
jgi:hypothetical protein